MRCFEGILPVLPVPFADDGALDLPGFRRVVHWAMAHGADGLSLFGLASEFWRLDDAEKRALAEALIESADDAPVALSVTDQSRITAERTARAFAQAGADGIIVMPPHFMSPRLDKVIDHCCAVADAAAPLPVMVQYSPAYVPVSMGADTFAEMHARSPNVRYVKVEPRPPGPMIDAIHRASDGALRCLIGQGGLSMADACRRGIAGLMPGVALLELHSRLWRELSTAPVTPEAWSLHDRVMALISHVVPTIDLWIAAEKQMLVWRGVADRVVLREPGSLPDEAFIRELRRLFDRVRSEWEGADRGK